MRELIIHDRAILPGESIDLILNSYPLHTKTHIEVPVFVTRAPEDGPVVLFCAGMHGEETNGIEIIRRLMLRDEVKKLKKGAIIFIPVLNTISFLFGSRDLPDGKDLNRCFPGSAKGSLGSRIAYDITTHIIPQIDCGVDFHTGGAKINNHPQIRCVFDFPGNLELAEKFSAPFIIDSSYREGTLRQEAAKKGKPILVYEGGESMRFDYPSINEGVNGCLRLLFGLGMIEFEVPAVRSVKIHSDSWIRASASGFFHLAKSNGSHINKGDFLGVICNPFGEVEHKIYAPDDGFIFGVNNQPVVNQGDALIHWGREKVN
jgi:predicted deacylase